MTKLQMLSLDKTQITVAAIRTQEGAAQLQDQQVAASGRGRSMSSSLGNSRVQFLQAGSIASNKNQTTTLTKNSTGGTFWTRNGRRRAAETRATTGDCHGVSDTWVSLGREESPTSGASD